MNIFQNISKTLHWIFFSIMHDFRTTWEAQTIQLPYFQKFSFVGDKRSMINFFPDMDQFGLVSSSVQLIWVED